MTKHSRHRDARDLDGGPVEPDHAATVMLLRPDEVGSANMEVLLLRRARSMPFAPGVYAFLGGRVDPRDAELGVRGEDAVPAWWAGPDPVLWAERLRVSVPLARALVCAAVRETYEESGVLLAGESESDTDIVTDTCGDDWEADRCALVAGTLSFGAFLSRRGLVLRSDLLLPWSRWITPSGEPRRYDTRFFAAVLPVGQHVRDVGEEHDHLQWTRPVDAVERWRQGDLLMLTPTVVTCEELADRGSLERVMATEREIVPIEPEIKKIDGRLRAIVPGGTEYRL